MKKNIYIALAVFAVIALWLLSGCFSSRKKIMTESKEAKIMRVQTVNLEATPTEKELVVSAKTAPARIVKLSAEVAGKIVSIGADRGSFLRENELILGIEQRNLPELVKQAQSLVKQRELEYIAGKDLFQKNYQSESNLASANSLLEQARASLKGLELDYANTMIAAPFPGLLNKRWVEVGDYVTVGMPLAELVETTPFIAVAYIAEEDVFKVKPGQDGYIVLANGKRMEGKIRYVSPYADPIHCLFTIELEIPNADLSLPVGETAELHVPLGITNGYAISPATLAIDDAGVFGVKVVDDKNMVIFYPVHIVKTTAEKVWVDNLPEKIQLITIGQAFAQTGEKVSPQPETNAN